MPGADLRIEEASSSDRTALEEALGRVLRVPVHLRLKWTHLVQASVQALLLVYWAVYSRGARTQLRTIAALVVFAFAFDHLVSRLRYRSWIVSLAPIPLVFSANLFVWFEPRTAFLSYAVVALALASKHLVHRGGRHVFNPSAFGVCAVGVLCLAAPQRFGELDLAHPLNITPNMLELVLFVGLVSMVRMPLVLMSLGAFATGLALPELAHGVSVPAVLWTPVFLGITLLITDPATTPREPLAQVAFGALYMLAFTVLALALEGYGRNEHWAKMLAVLPMNLLAPSLDRLAARVPVVVPLRLLGPRWNFAHVVLWIVVVTQSVSPATKARFYEGDLAARQRIAHTRLGPDGRASCRENPVFCTPFSFGAEWSMWRSGRVAGP